VRNYMRRRLGRLFIGGKKNKFSSPPAKHFGGVHYLSKWVRRWRNRRRGVISLISFSSSAVIPEWLKSGLCVLARCGRLRQR
jgi:hypothetical protein